MKLSLSYLVSLNVLVVKEEEKLSVSLPYEVTVMINEHLVHRYKIDCPWEPVRGPASCL